MIDIIQIGDTVIRIPEQLVGLGIVGLILYGLFFIAVAFGVIWVFVKVFRGFSEFEREFPRKRF